MSRKANDEIIFFDIKHCISWRKEQIDGGRHVNDFFKSYIDFKIFQNYFSQG